MARCRLSKVRGRAVKTAAELREEAKRKRHSAGIARRAVPLLSVAADQVTMRRSAQVLETEAAELEAAADTMDAKDRRH